MRHIGLDVSLVNTIPQYQHLQQAHNLDKKSSKFDGFDSLNTVTGSANHGQRSAIVINARSENYAAGAFNEPAPASLSQLIEAVQKLTQKISPQGSVDAPKTDIFTVINTINSCLEQSASHSELREDLFNIRQALKRVAKTSDTEEIRLLIRRLEPLIGEAFFKRKRDENIKIRELQMARIQELAKLRQQLNEL